jgi:hypothetical protein
MRAAVTLAVLGAGLVVAAVHGTDSPSARTAPVAAASAARVTYTPPTAVSSPVGGAPVAVHVTAHPLVRVVARKPAAHRPAPRHSVTRPVAPTAAARRVVRPAATTFTAALMAQVARIPTYRTGSARWVVSRAYDFWGTADWYHDVLYISPDVPRSKLYDVAVHEWSHELSVLDYNGDVDAATRAMNTWFAGTGLTGPERAADCMAILQGATWTHYTTCTNSKWRAGAKLLVSGHPL